MLRPYSVHTNTGSPIARFIGRLWQFVNPTAQGRLPVLSCGKGDEIAYSGQFQAPLQNTNPYFPSNITVTTMVISRQPRK